MNTIWNNASEVWKETLFCLGINSEEEDAWAKGAEDRRENRRAEFRAALEKSSSAALPSSKPKGGKKGKGRGKQHKTQQWTGGWKSWRQSNEGSQGAADTSAAEGTGASRSPSGKKWWSSTGGSGPSTGGEDKTSQDKQWRSHEDDRQLSSRPSWAGRAQAPWVNKDRTQANQDAWGSKDKNNKTQEWTRGSDQQSSNRGWGSGGSSSSYSTPTKNTQYRTPSSGWSTGSSGWNTGGRGKGGKNKSGKGGK